MTSVNKPTEAFWRHFRPRLCMLMSKCTAFTGPNLSLTRALFEKFWPYVSRPGISSVMTFVMTLCMTLSSAIVNIIILGGDFPLPSLHFLLEVMMRAAARAWSKKKGRGSMGPNRENGGLCVCLCVCVFVRPCVRRIFFHFSSKAIS